MKKIYIILVLVFVIGISTSNIYAQFVVAQDTIRGRIDFCDRPGDLNNGLIIPNDTVFYLFPPDLEIDPWRNVDLYLPNRDIRQGYIRGTDLMRVDDYDVVEVERLSSHGSISFKSNDIRVNIVVANIKSNELANKQYSDGNNYINGKKARGISRWGHPRLKYQSITVSIKGRNIPIPRKVYEHLFEPEIDNMIVYHNPLKDIVYIVTNNGGINTYYNAMWAVSPQGVANAYIYDPSDRK